MMKKLAGFRKCKGVALPELIVVSIIIGILFILAYPSYQNMLARFERFRILSQINGLMAELRSEAAINRTRIAVCGTQDGMNCDSNAWSEGLLVFYDNEKYDREHQPNEKIRNYFKLNLKYGTLSWKGAGANNIIFQEESGIPRGANGSFFYCSTHIESFRLYMSFMGHTRHQILKSC